MGSADLRQLAYWAVTDGVLPSAARSPWDAVGGGGTLATKGVRIAAAATRKGYRRLTADRRVRDRMEIQADFAGSTSAPTWDSGSPAHMLWIDDGHRAVGLAIGDLIAVVDPTDGTVLAVVPSDKQPGGWLSRQSYHLIKDGTSTWDMYVNGRLIYRLPYSAGAESALDTAGTGFGWQDATALSAGIGTWDRVEVGVNETLPPHWKVDKARLGMGPALAAEWNPTHEAFLRAMVGLAHTVQDAEARARELFTAQVRAVQSGSFDGSQDPALDGWALVGSGAQSTVRERQRLAAGDDPTYFEWTFDAPVQTDGVFYAAARFTLVSSDSPLDPFGRVGPFLQVADGNLAIGAFMRRDLAIPDAVGWFLSSAGPSGAGWDATGETVFLVDPTREALVELYLIGRERVLLFIDGEIVEDAPYARFDSITSETTDVAVRIGRDGAAGTIQATVDLTDAQADIRYGSNDRRAEFLRRVAERLLFASGCERNDVLDAWMRHRPGVFRARGTDRVISEVRRVACDDEAEIITIDSPAAWYLEATWPEITPVFLAEAGATVRDTVVEYRIDAPNFQPADLSKLIRTYLIPRGIIESTYTALLISELTSDATFTTIPPGIPVYEFDVERTLGFAVGDPVTLRQWTEEPILTLEYDTGGVGAADNMAVGVDHGRIRAVWSAAWVGQAGQTLIAGYLNLVGKDAEKLANVTAGGTIKLKGSSGAVALYAEVFGIQTGTGAAIMRRYHVLGTVDVTDATLWAEVHGVICDRAAQAAFSVIDVTGAATLYTVPLGARARGAYLFDPPLLCGPLALEVTADGATTKKLVAWGVEEDADETGSKITLAGAVKQTTAEVYSAIRVLAMGYVEAARTLLCFARMTDPGASIRLVSSSVNDRQVFRVYAVDREGTALWWDGAMTGTTPVILPASSGLWHVLGVQLFEAAIGTVTVTMTGTQTVTICTITAGNRLKGVKEAGIEAVGQIAVTPSGLPTTPPWLLVYGLDRDLAPQAAVIRLDAESRLLLAESWTEIQAFAGGNIDPGVDMTLDGIAWRADSANGALAAIAGRPLWTASGPAGGETALDGQLDDAVLADVTSGPVDFDGRFSVSEETVIVAIDGHTVDVELLTGTFTAGAVMRKT